MLNNFHNDDLYDILSNFQSELDHYNYLYRCAVEENDIQERNRLLDIIAEIELEIEELKENLIEE